MIVTFFGHKDTPCSIKPIVEKVIEELIINFSADRFYIGNQGAFDNIVRDILQELKDKYQQIDYAVVLAYMPGKYKRFENYEETIFPEGFESFHPRYAISKRNEWMINEADIVVSYVSRSIGGASKFKSLAEKKKKKVINIAEIKEPLA